MTEYIAYVAVFPCHRAPLFRGFMPKHQITDKAFARNVKFIGHCIPRTDKDSPLGNILFQLFRIFGLYTVVVLDCNRLPVKMKGLKFSIGIKQSKKLVYHFDKAVSEPLEILIPFAIPMSA